MPVRQEKGADCRQAVIGHARTSLTRLLLHQYRTISNCGKFKALPTPLTAGTWPDQAPKPLRVRTYCRAHAHLHWWRLQAIVTAFVDDVAAAAY